MLGTILRPADRDIFDEADRTETYCYGSCGDNVPKMAEIVEHDKMI